MKHKRLRKLSALLFIFVLLSTLGMGIVLAEPPTVHAVLFYLPTCSHCHHVITEVLPPLFEQYGDQLEMLGVDISTSGGQTLYDAAIQRFDIPSAQQAVPTLILGEVVLVGSLEIPEQFPRLIEQYLAQGGIDWPDIPGLADALQANKPEVEATPESTQNSAATTIAPASDSPSYPAADSIAPRSGSLSLDDTASDDLISKFQRDPAGNTVSVLLLIGMVAVIVHVLRYMWQTWRMGISPIPFVQEMKGWRSWFVAVLCLLGLGVSVYMAYVETTHAAAVCGPIGDCNTVQQSPYAVLLGLIPVGILGILGYAAMLITWAGTKSGAKRFKHLSESALFGMALFGTLFSIYLTFLEPFVIGASCAWCLTSAVSMTLILFILSSPMPVSTDPPRQAARV